jgi:hypothetical protein
MLGVQHNPCSLANQVLLLEPQAQIQKETLEGQRQLRAMQAECERLLQAAEVRQLLWGMRSV